MELTESNLISLRDAIADQSVSAAEVLRGYLDRIERFNSGLNAIDEVYADRAQARAAAVDAGEVTGPLAGVPIAIKDNLCTDFGHTKCGSRMLEHFAAPYTATAVRKLEEAGAVIIGKTTMDEFAMGSSTEHGAFGRCANPWQREYVTGGSSGGSAAAVAADLCAGSLGSDTGGSIRQPAAYCGVVGLKPTYSRVSRYGLVAFASSLDQIGPFGHTVADVALLLSVIAGHDAKDSTSATAAVPDYLAAVNNGAAGGTGEGGSLRVGIARQYVTDANGPAVAEALGAAMKLYESNGASLVEIDLPHTEYGIPVYYIVATAEASSNLARYDGVHYGHRTERDVGLIDLYAESRGEGFGDEVKRRIMLGTYALSSGYYDAYYNRALKVRRLIKDDFDRAFEKCDVILCPTSTHAAFKAGELIDDPLAMYQNDIYTVNANLAGIPGISLPAGFDEAAADGAALPIGLQLFARHFDEATLLRAAAIYQAGTDHHTRRPALG